MKLINKILCLIRGHEYILVITSYIGAGRLKGMTFDPTYHVECKHCGRVKP